MLFRLVTLIMFGFASSAQGGGVIVKLCYIPLGVDTYVPMTVTNIDKHCSYVGELGINDKKYTEIQSIIKKASVGSFADEFVRVKITVSENEQIYIDNYGGVNVGNAQYKIDTSGLMRIKKILEQVTSKISR